jgi:prepilin-type N-terminal cleavage/methylation domain-containing protein
MRRSNGFTLVEIVVVLLIFSVVLAMATVIVRAVTASQKRSITASRMAAIDAAIGQFVAVNKRLPCPADGRKPSADPGAGLETARDVATGCTAQQHGVVPWRVLGIGEQDAVDGWSNRFTYRASGTLAADSGMDMSKCDTAGTAAVNPAAVCDSTCASTSLNTCTPPKNFLTGKGWEIRTISTAPIVKVMDPTIDPPTGAAYVVISHGESGGGAYNTNGVIQTTTSGGDGDSEKVNYADAPVGTYYVDDSIFEATGATTHFDDSVSRPAILTVVSKAGLGPRSH